MGDDRRGSPTSLSAVEAGSVLGLPPDVVRALADAGYLRTASLAGGVPRFALVDLKGFQARTLDSTEAPELDPADDLDPDALLPLVEDRVPSIALRTLELLGTVVPEVRAFTDEQRSRFLEEAELRIEGVLAACANGPGSDPDLEQDLAEIGADAAHHGVPLGGVLLVLRSSRDLVVQTAVEIAEERGRRWGLALAVALTRVLPAIDRLSDAVARGYWEAVLEIEAEGIDRFHNVVDRAADGVFALDRFGIVDHVNESLAGLVGRPAQELLGRHVSDALGVEPGEPGVVAGWPVRQFERLREGVVIGWDGLVGSGQRVVEGGEEAGAAAGVVDERDGLGDDPVGDLPERLGGGTVADGDGGATVAPEGDGGLERHLPE